MIFPRATLLQGTSEAHEDKHVYCEQVGQKDVSRAGAARQQPGEVEAPASEPAATRHHPAFHLGDRQETVRSREGRATGPVKDGTSTFRVIKGWFGLRLRVSHSSSVSMSILKSL